MLLLMGLNNFNELKRKIQLFKLYGLNIDIYYSICSPNIIVRENKNILTFRSQKELNFYINKQLENVRKLFEEELLNKKGIFKDE